MASTVESMTLNQLRMRFFLSFNGTKLLLFTYMVGDHWSQLAARQIAKSSKCMLSGARSYWHASRCCPNGDWWWQVQIGIILVNIAQLSCSWVFSRSFNFKLKASLGKAILGGLWHKACGQIRIAIYITVARECVGVPVCGTLTDIDPIIVNYSVPVVGIQQWRIYPSWRARQCRGRLSVSQMWISVNVAARPAWLNAASILVNSSVC